MKKSKMIAALATGLLLSTGAAAADSNLGAATVGASQTGMFQDGLAGVSAPMALVVAAVVFAVISEEVTDYTAPESGIVPLPGGALPPGSTRAHTPAGFHD